MLKHARRLLLAAALIAATAGCSSWNDQRGRGDAPVDSYDDEPAVVINFPDKFANVAVKCLGSTGVYTSTREAPPVVVPQDAHCTEGGR